MATCSEYDLIVARYGQAKADLDRARHVLELAELEMDAAERALSKHEVSTGVPLCIVAGA